MIREQLMQRLTDKFQVAITEQNLKFFDKPGSGQQIESQRYLHMPSQDSKIRLTNSNYILSSGGNSPQKQTPMTDEHKYREKLILRKITFAPYSPVHQNEE